jgi:RND family efflux transporter MFP subunit
MKETGHLSRSRALLAVGALAATTAAMLSLLPSPALAVPELTTVTRTDLSSAALVGGLVVPERSTPLYFSPTVIAAGSGRTRRVKAVYVKKGQSVSEGDVLVELDGDDLVQRLDDARSALRRAQEAQRQAEAARKAQEARIAQLAAQAAEAEASAQKAASAAAQAQSTCASLANSLVETAIEETAALPPPPPPPSLASMPRTQAALAALLECQANLAKASGSAGASSATSELLAAQLGSLRSSQSQVSAASAQVSAARKNVEQMERLVRALTITAPYDGIISVVNVDTGNSVQSGVPALELRTAKLVARADLAEGDLLGLAPGSSAHLSIKSAGIELSSTLTSVAEDPRAYEGGPVTYPAYFDLPPLQSIKPGQLVRAKIVTETRRGVLAVPSSAVTESKGLYYVVVVSDGKEEPRRVVPGLSDENFTEILQGLQEGEKVRTLAPRL